MRRNSGDLQERIVQLYFVRGWSVRSICERYGLSKAMAHKLLAEWRVRAVESGYIQEIEPGILAALTEETELAQADSGVAAFQPLPSVTPQLPGFSYASTVPATIPSMKNPVSLSAGRGM